MSDLVNRLRLQAEDLHSLNPASETVKCLSLGADEIDRLRARVEKLEAENAKLRTIPMRYRRMEFNAQLQQEAKTLRARVKELEASVAFEMDWPDFHAEAMGCGLEDRNITDRYEAMRYGWDEAIECCAERLPEELYTHAPDASAIIAAKDAKIAELISENIEQQKYILSMERIISELITRKEAQK